MFYSKDLLSKRSPLGAIWMVAHGKKLSKNKLLGISVEEICEEILHPEVPHSLRLQGILVGGIVVVFSRQQTYLLDDVYDMMKRIKDSISLAGGGTSKATLKRGRDKAKREAITLGEEYEEGELMEGGLDMNNALMLDSQAPMAFLAAGAGGAFGLRGLPPSQPGLPSGQMIGDEEFFAVPAVSGAPSERVAAAGARPGSRTTSGTLAGRQGSRPGSLVGAGEEVFEGLAGPEGEDLLLADELGFGYMEGEEVLNDVVPGQADGRRASIGAAANNRVGLSGDVSREESEHGSEVEGGEGLPLSPRSAEREHQARRAAAAALTGDYAAHDQEHLTEEGEDEGVDVDRVEGVRPRGGLKKRGAARHQGGGARVITCLPRKPAVKLGMDDQEGLLIRSMEFRQWTLERRDITRPHPTALMPRNRALNDLWTTAADPTARPLLFSDPLPRFAGGSRAPGGLPLSAPLMDVLRRAAAPPASAAGADDAAAIMGKAATGRRPTKRARSVTPGLDEEDGGASRDRAGLGAEEDMLGDLPFMGDEREEDSVEVERLRAASATPGGSLPSGVLPGGAAGANGFMPGGLLVRQASSLMTGDTSSRPSSVLPARHLLPGRAGSVSGAPTGSDLLLPGGEEFGGLPDLMGGHHDDSGGAHLLHWGNAGLEDLLPALGVGSAGDSLGLDLSGDVLGGLKGRSLRADTSSESGAGGVRLAATSEEGSDEEGHEEGEHRSGRIARAGAAAAAGAALRSKGRAEITDTDGTDTGRPGTFDVPLLETVGDGTEPMQSMGMGGGASAMSRNTATALKLFRAQMSVSGRAAGDSAGGRGAMPPPGSVSFLSLAQMLRRHDAIQLFMQVLVTQTKGYIHAAQDTPLGDIIITPGPRMTHPLPVPGLAH